MFSGLVRLLAILFVLSLFSIPAYSEDMPGTGEEAPCNTIEYFYTMGCPHCFKANIFLEQLQKEYPERLLSPQKRAEGEADKRNVQWTFLSTNGHTGMYAQGSSDAGQHRADQGVTGSFFPDEKMSAHWDREVEWARPVVMPQ